MSSNKEVALEKQNRFLVGFVLFLSTSRPTLLRNHFKPRKSPKEKGGEENMRRAVPDTALSLKTTEQRPSAGDKTQHKHLKITQALNYPQKQENHTNSK